MNLWHQRIIIFLAKVFGVIAGLFFLGYFLYYNVYFKTDFLIKYVPKNAVAYATFKLTPKLSQNVLTQKIKQYLQANNNLPLEDFARLNQLSGNNFSIALVPENNGIGVLLLSDLGIDKQEAKYYYDAAKAKGWQAQIYSNQIKSSNIVAVASSADLISQVDAVVAQKDPNLGQRIEVVLNLKKFNQGNFFGKAFIENDYLAKAIAGSDLRYNLLAIMAKSDLPAEIFTGWKISGHDLAITTQNNDELADDLNGLASNLPANTAYALTFTDLSEQWQSALKILWQENPQYFQTVQNNLEYLQNLYNFNFNDDFLPLFGNQDQIIITQDNQVLLATSIDNQEILPQTAKIENLLKTYISNQYPMIKSRQLPDGTAITSVEREPNNFSFQTDKFDGFNINYINWASQEFLYILNGSQLILANSRKIVTDLLNTDQKINQWQLSGKLINLSNFSDNALVYCHNISLPVNLSNLCQLLMFNFDSGSKNFRLILE